LISKERTLQEGKKDRAPKGKSESPWSLYLTILGQPFFIAYSRRVRVGCWKAESWKRTTAKKYSYGNR